MKRSLAVIVVMSGSKPLDVYGIRSVESENCTFNDSHTAKTPRNMESVDCKTF